MDKRTLILGAVTLAILIAALALFLVPAPMRNAGGGTTPTGTSTPVTTHDDLIRVTSPAPGEAVSSPVIVKGQARGSWYFEAQFPVQVLDQSGNVVGQGPATAQGDWETADYVPFTDTLILTTTPPAGSPGTIVLNKDNPSGNPATADELRVPVIFQ